MIKIHSDVFLWTWNSDRPFMVVDVTGRSVVLDRCQLTVGARKNGDGGVMWIPLREFLKEVHSKRVKFLTPAQQLKEHTSNIKREIKWVENDIKPKLERITSLKEQLQQLKGE